MNILSSIRFLNRILIFFLFIYLFGCGGNDSKTIEPEELMEQLYQKFRSTAVSSMKKAANEVGLNIVDTDLVTVAIPMTDESIGALVSTEIDSAEKLTLDQLSKGTDVMFIFVPFSIKGLTQDNSNDGFYIVNIFEEAGRWHFSLKNKDQKIVLIGNAEVKKTENQLPFKSNLSFSIGIKGLCIDKKTNDFIINICLYMDFDLPLQTPISKYGQMILDAANELVNGSFNTITKVMNNNTLALPIIGGVDDLFVSHTNILAIENMTIEELSNGATVFYEYVHGTQLPNGFYNVYIFKEGIEKWKARFINPETGETVLTTDAMVKKIDVKTPKFVLIIEYPTVNPKDFKPGIKLGHLRNILKHNKT